MLFAMLVLFTYLFPEAKFTYSLNYMYSLMDFDNYLYTHYPNKDAECFYPITEESPLMPLCCQPLLLPRLNYCSDFFYHQGEFACSAFSHRWIHSVCSLACLVSFPQCNYFEIPPCSCMYQYLIPFLWLSSISLHGYTNILLRHLLIDMGVVSSLGLL